MAGQAAVSISRGSYGVDFLGHNLPATLVSGSAWMLWIMLRNTGTRTWPHDLPRGLQTDMVVYVDDTLCQMVTLPESVPPGGAVTFSFQIGIPDRIGRHVLRLELLEQQVAWFRDHHVAP